MQRYQFLFWPCALAPTSALAVALALSLVIALPLTPSLALAGNELGNGGDGFAQEFVATGHRIVDELGAKPDPAVQDPAALAQAVEAAKVFTSDRLELEGHEVDALNFPRESRIELNRARWKDYDVNERRALVLHEYLGLCCSQDLNYQVSSSHTDVNMAEVHASHRIDAQVRSGRSSNYLHDRPSGPSFGATVGYELSHRATLGLSFDRFAYDGDNFLTYTDHERLLEYGASFKYWLNDAKKLRPYATATVGLAEIHYDSVAGGWDSETVWHSPYSTGYVFGTIGPGLNYRLTHTVGLDASVLLHTLHDVNPPKKMSNFVVAQLGMNLFL